MLQDVTYAIRTLRRQPGFALAATAILALGIGLSVTVFTIFSAVALRGWAVRDSGRIVNIYRVRTDVPGGSRGAFGFSVAEARFLDANARGLSGIIATRPLDLRLESEIVARRWSGMAVTGNYFQVLGIDMERGRGFTAEEDSSAAAPEAVAVLSYLAWQNRFGGDHDIVGRRIRLDEVPFTVVGVAARGFAGTLDLLTDVWIPFASLRVLRPLDASVPDLLTKPDYCCSAVAGRLGHGISRDQARAELDLLNRRFDAQFAAARDPSSRSTGIVLTDTAIVSHPGTKGSATALLALMAAGVALIVVLACANVGNLLIARATTRQREIATRLSIGASRFRIVRQLMTESVVLSALAMVFGIAIAYKLPAFVLSHLTPERFNARVDPDATVLAFALALSFIVSMAAGLAPALHATRVSFSSAMKQQGFESRLRLRSLLLAVQVFVSVVMLVSAGLMVRGIQHAYAMDPGFHVSDVDVVSFDLPASAYNPPRIRSFVRDLRVALDGVTALQPFGLARSVPFANGHWSASVRLPGEDKSRDRLVESQEVAAGYFQLLGIPIVSGRDFTAADPSPGVVLINETMARRYWPDRSAVGQTLVSVNSTLQVIGIVKDTYATALTAIEPLMYAPLGGRDVPQLLVRAAPGGYDAVTAAVKALDPRIQVRVEPLTAERDRHLTTARTTAWLAGVLGLLALVLAAVGMFGVFAYVVGQRTREIGIRSALGAQPAQVVRLVLASSSGPVLIGLALGFAASTAAAQLMRRFLFGVSVLDPAAYASVCMILVCAAIAATLAPTRRAIRIDPASALRCE